jgi:hypothetical protein
MSDSVSRTNVSPKKLVNFLLVPAKRLFYSSAITALSIATVGFVLWIVGFPQDPSLLRRLFIALLFPDLISWGLDKLSQYWNYRHSKSIVSASTPLISIVAFWAVFCRCPLDVILSDGHWRILALLLLYPAYKVFRTFWEILRSENSKTV